MENDSARAELGQRAIALMDAWDLPRAHQREILALSADEWSRVQLGAPLPLQWEVLERVELICACPRPGMNEAPPWTLLREDQTDLEAFQAWLAARA